MAIRTRRGAAGALLALLAIGIASLRGRLRRFEIAEGSMRPALDPGDYVLAVRRTRLDRGSIVVYPSPDAPEFSMVKRVIGLGGETITIANGQVSVGDAILAEPWADGPVHPDGRWDLRSDELFVLGDARAVSAGDSRSTGPVPAQQVDWRVVWRYWPLQRIGRV